ncbi:hypothetical protein OsI_26836 [Oryza sativa Indica Group]|uniref:Uncharacterized protein n=2 Tax=Oryza sativa TaxID=4530 RepID=B9FU67_ORYSJ|nr:hypothetical protein OsI_26836 [Oryza sativa Indica Group]EEE67574.1 hypothetical protein OsJ_25098 [Oryza sativa Japonica Group]
MARQTRREARSGSMTSSSPHPSLPSPVLPPQPHGTGAGLAAHRRQRPVSSSLRSRLSSSSLHDPIRERRLYRPHQLLHPHRRRVAAFVGLESFLAAVTTRDPSAGNNTFGALPTPVLRQFSASSPSSDDELCSPTRTGEQFRFTSNG